MSEEITTLGKVQEAEPSDSASIRTKLMHVQRDLIAPKNQRNNFGGYNYRSAEDILEAVKPLAAREGAAIKLCDEMVEVGGRVYVMATASFIDCESGAAVCAKACAREEESKKGMDASQITGAASSYARKYALNGLFAIDDCKDADATNKHGKDASAERGKSEVSENPKLGALFTPEQARQAEEWAKKLNPKAYELALAALKITSLEQLPYSRKRDFMDAVKRKVQDFEQFERDGSSAN